MLKVNLYMTLFIAAIIFFLPWPEFSIDKNFINKMHIDVLNVEFDSVRVKKKFFDNFVIRCGRFKWKYAFDPQNNKKYSENSNKIQKILNKQSINISDSIYTFDIKKFYVSFSAIKLASYIFLNKRAVELLKNSLHRVFCNELIINHKNHNALHIKNVEYDVKSIPFDKKFKFYFSGMINDENLCFIGSYYDDGMDFRCFSGHDNQFMLSLKKWFQSSEDKLESVLHPTIFDLYFNWKNNTLSAEFNFVSKDFSFVGRADYVQNVLSTNIVAKMFQSDLSICTLCNKDNVHMLKIKNFSLANILHYFVDNTKYLSPIVIMYFDEFENLSNGIVKNISFEDCEILINYCKSADYLCLENIKVKYTNLVIDLVFDKFSVATLKGSGDFDKDNLAHKMTSATINGVEVGNGMLRLRNTNCFKFSDAEIEINLMIMMSNIMSIINSFVDSAKLQAFFKRIDGSNVHLNFLGKISDQNGFTFKVNAEMKKLFLKHDINFDDFAEFKNVSLKCSFGENIIHNTTIQSHSEDNSKNAVINQNMSGIRLEKKHNQADKIIRSDNHAINEKKLISVEGSGDDFFFAVTEEFVDKHYSNDTHFVTEVNVNISPYVLYNLGVNLTDYIDYKSKIKVDIVYADDLWKVRADLTNARIYLPYINYYKDFDKHLFVNFSSKNLLKIEDFELYHFMQNKKVVLAHGNVELNSNTDLLYFNIRTFYFKNAYYQLRPTAEVSALNYCLIGINLQVKNLNFDKNFVECGDKLHEIENTNFTEILVNVDDFNLDELLHDVVYNAVIKTFDAASKKIEKSIKNHNINFINIKIANLRKNIYTNFEFKDKKNAYDKRENIANDSDKYFVAVLAEQITLANLDLSLLVETKNNVFWLKNVYGSGNFAHSFNFHDKFIDLKNSSKNIVRFHKKVKNYVKNKIKYYNKNLGGRFFISLNNAKNDLELFFENAGFVMRFFSVSRAFFNGLLVINIDMKDVIEFIDSLSTAKSENDCKVAIDNNQNQKKHLPVTLKIVDADLEIKKANFFMKLLSAGLSFFTLTNIFNKIFSSSLSASLLISNDIIIVQNSYLNFMDICITSSGEINFKRHNMNLGGEIMPFHYISKIVNLVPFSEVINPDGHGIVSMGYVANGKLDNFKVKIHPFSIFLLRSMKKKTKSA